MYRMNVNPHRDRFGRLQRSRFIGATHPNSPYGVSTSLQGFALVMTDFPVARVRKVMRVRSFFSCSLLVGPVTWH